MKSLDVESAGGGLASPAAKEKDKDSHHVTIVDPAIVSNRRARWLNEKIMLGKSKHQNNGGGSKHFDKMRNGSLKQHSKRREKDSGFHEDSAGLTKTSFSNEDLGGRGGGKNYSSSERWRSKPCDDFQKCRLRNTYSLNQNLSQYIDDDFLPVTATPFSQTVDDPEDDPDDPDLTDGHFGLSRQNGIRHSLNRHHPHHHHHHHHHHMEDSPTESAISISSESGGSQLHRRILQEELDAQVDDDCRTPGKHHILFKDKWKRQSIFFNSSDSWLEEGIDSTLRALSASKACIFECAWSGDVQGLTSALLLTPAPSDDLPSSPPTPTKSVKNLQDATGRTPLHLAAACGHVDAVKLLLEQGADIEACDYNHKATPLMCAAGCGSLATVQLLIERGANVNAGYESGKTALLWAVQAESADCTKVLLENGALQNPPIAYSETALHIAAALGNLACLELLIEYGADVTLKKGDYRSTALHLAAEEGNIPCIKRLLKAGAAHSAQDARGQTPLHIAAQSDTDVTAMLLAAGADPHIVDDNGRTSLHCAVARGSRAAECVRLLIEAGAEVNAQDSFGYTPLHLAGVNESSQCASILLHHGADVTAKTKAGTTVLSVLVRKIPDVVRYLVERLDSAVTIHDHDPGDPDCEIRLDFRAIVPNTEKRLPGKNSQKFEQIYYNVPRKETEFLTCLLAAGNKKILAHPLSEAFLHLKWKRVRKFFWASLFFQIALVLLYTTYVLNTYLTKCPYFKNPDWDHNNSTTIVTATTGLPLALSAPGALAPGAGQPEASRGPRTKRRVYYDFSFFNLDPMRKVRTTMKPTTLGTPAAPPGPPRGPRLGPGFQGPLPPPPPESRDGAEEDEVETTETYCELGWSLKVVWWLLVFFTLVLAIKEVFQLVQSPLAYVLSSENWGQWALIGSVTVTAWPASSPGLVLAHWQYPAAAFGIFLAYSLMLLQVGRQPALGLYVQMLGKVAANFGLFILAYVCLLIAFALAFCVIFPGNPAYSSPPLALMKVLTMMVGEVDYQEQFYGEDEKAHVPYPIAAHVLHSAFVVFISIILMNLLVGLAVHDIQGLQKGAKLNRLSRQTTLICRLESFIFSKRLQACLPRTLGILLRKNALLVPSSYSWSYYFRPNDPRDKRIPKELKKAALRLAAARHAAKHGRSYNYGEAVISTSGGGGLGGGARPSSASQYVVNANEANFRRMDIKIDKLQKQLDTSMRLLNENLKTLVERST